MDSGFPRREPDADALDPTAARIAANVRAKIAGSEPSKVEIGRFELHGEIGSGGMGTVHAAYDDQLDRTVAVKLLHVHRGDTHGEQQRLLREAQALARLSHPNVVQVYEAGTHEGAVFLAMEHLAGPSVQDWQFEERREWRTVIECYVQAGEGLAAAHEAGLVHRDFKPGNLLFGGDGRVRVVDFGLARTSVHDDAEASPTEDPELSDEPDEKALVSYTTTGSLLGTPAYMSPEQARREPVDARSDQYSFCVALYEALYGVRPHEGRSVAAVVTAIASGTVRPPPRNTPVPTRISAAIMRGLSTEPGDRFPSMGALLRELGYDPAARRRRILNIAGLGGSLAVTGGLVIGAFAMREHPCEGIDARLVAAWSEETRDTVRDAFLGTEHPVAQRAWDQAREALDGWAADWHDRRDATCQAHHVQRTMSAELHDLGVRCLERRLTEVELLVRELEAADADVVLNAATAVAQLPSLTPCEDADELRTRVRPPAGADVARVEAQVSKASALRRVGRPEEALDVVSAAVSGAEALDYPPLLAEALYERALVRERLLSRDDTNDLERATNEAVLGHDDPLLARIWTRLGYSYVIAGRPERAELALRVATTWQRRTNAEPADRLLLLRAQSLLALARKDVESGLRTLARADVLVSEELDGDRLAAAGVHTIRSELLAADDDLDAAVDEQRQALELREQTLGAGHPDLARDCSNLGRVLFKAGRHEEARAAYERALQLRTLLGAERDRFVVSLHTALTLLAGASEDADAEAAHTRATVEAAQGLPLTDPAVRVAKAWAVDMYSAEGQLGKALAANEELVAWYETGDGDPGQRTAVLINSAGMMMDLAQPETARERLDQARDVAAGLPGKQRAVFMAGIEEVEKRLVDSPSP